MSAETKSKAANSTKNEPSDGFDWNAENEVHLFYALKGHKPVGVNRHFHMICVQDLFNNLVNKDVSSRVIWDHLDRLYDMEALHENEDIPFPNEEIDFSLPSSDFDDLIARKVSGKADDSAYATKNDLLTSSNKESGSQSESETNAGKEKKDDNKTDTKVENASEKQKENAQKDEKDTKNASAKKRSQKTPTTNSKGGQTPNNSNGSTSSKKRRV